MSANDAIIQHPGEKNILYVQTLIERCQSPLKRRQTGQSSNDCCGNILIIFQKKELGGGVAGEKMATVASSGTQTHKMWTLTEKEAAKYNCGL